MAIRTLLYGITLMLFGMTSAVVCQNNEFRLPPTKSEAEKCLREENICEQLEKLRIAHEKKEHEEMVSRAEEALKLSEELEKSIVANPQLNERDREKLQSFEKLVRKIRSELGAKDVDADPDKNDSNDTESADDGGDPSPPKDVVSGFKVLRESTIQLVNEIRKSTRFTISAAAIATSNAVLKLTRILRIWR
jgi:hypothetical protein